MLDETIRATRIQLKENILLDNVYHGNKKERKQIFDLLHRTVEVGESNSALLIGPRASGKTKLVDDVVAEIKSLHNFDSNCKVVHLNGLIHTDDKLALVGITSQMHLDNVVGDKVFGSFAENLAFLLACLRTGTKKTSKSVLFVIEEFDLFCAHTNQTLLYNLFDVSQSAQAPICVLGITCRLDVIELLEKRVKSRFSHRQFFVFPGGGQQDGAELDSYMERIVGLLSVEPNRSLGAKFVAEWNRNIRTLTRDKKLRTLMQRFMDISLNETALKNMLLSMAVGLGKHITYSDFEQEMQRYEKDEVVEQLLDVTVLEMCLLISMKHHYEIYDGQPMNFEMIYGRYVKFANVSSNVQTVQRPIVMKAYEHLVGMELVQRVSGSSRVQREYEMFRLLVTKQQIMEAVRRWQGLPTDVAQWAISSFV